MSSEENPRQRLVEIIGSKGPISIKDLKQQTGMSTGSLYHHLSKLGEYIAQDQQKRYLLSERGQTLLATKPLPEAQKPAWYVAFMLPVMRSKYASILTIIAVVQLYVLLYANSGQLLLIPVKNGGAVQSVALGLLLSILAAEGLCIAAGARAGRKFLGLAAGISLATVPAAAFSLVDMEHSYAASIPLYALSLFVASSAISGAKGTSYATSIAVALSIMMVSIITTTASLGAVVVIPIAITVAIIAVARAGYFDIAADALGRTRT